MRRKERYILWPYIKSDSMQETPPPPKLRPKSSRLGSAAVDPSRAAVRCLMETKQTLEEKMEDLLHHFGQLNLEALMNVSFL